MLMAPTPPVPSRVAIKTAGLCRASNSVEMVAGGGGAVTSGGASYPEPGEAMATGPTIIPPRSWSRSHQDDMVDRHGPAQPDHCVAGTPAVPKG